MAVKCVVDNIYVALFAVKYPMLTIAFETWSLCDFVCTPCDSDSE